MNAAAARLESRLLLVQFFVGLAVFALFVATAPSLLLLDPEETRGAGLTTLWVAIGTEVVAQPLTFYMLSKLRYVLRALALGSRAFEPEELVDLAAIPGRITRISVFTASAFALTTLLPPFRADGVDLGTQIALLLLAFLLIAAAALPLYVYARKAVSDALELVPPDAAREVLELLERDDVPRRRVHANFVAALLVPIAFVAAGAALVAHAHVRTAATKLRVDTAIAIARGAVEVVPGAQPLAGRAAAMRVAQEAGFPARVRAVPSLFEVLREADGRVSVSVPIAEGYVAVSFAGGSRVLVAPRVLIACAFAIVLAAYVGFRLGRALAADLVVAAEQVRSLGSEDVLRGGAHIAGPARFQVVTELGRAIDDLTERFRVFAAAQERAIDARQAALRLRGLLFASVSHDLKSPLNAVLGFCTLVSAEPLSAPQLESVAIIERRARELLALIETILDAARVEAQRLSLVCAPVPVARVVEQAVERGDELGPMDAAPVTVRVDPTLPDVSWDEGRMAQALAALIGHAKRLSPHGGVVVEAQRKDPRLVAITVRDPSTTFSVAELSLLLDPTKAASAQGRHGGLALGLSLARALMELHGGRLSVESAPGGGAVFRAVVPVAALPAAVMLSPAAPRA